METPLTVGSRMLETMLPGDDFTHCILRNCLSAILASPGFFCSQENDRELMERVGEFRETLISAQQHKTLLQA